LERVFRQCGSNQEQQRYAQEQVKIEWQARDKEHERDRKSAEADQLLHEHHRFADSIALLQVAIALGAIAARTRPRPFGLVH
jgi:protein required for attachment to host cells